MDATITTTTDTRRKVPRPRHVGFALIAIAGILMAGTGAIAGTTNAVHQQLAELRQATDAFHNLDLALAAGYGEFYICTDKDKTGAMGQHYVKGALVEDPTLDRLRPEVLVYEPRRDGGYQLVAVEYVVLKQSWHDAFGKARPRLFGRTLSLVTAPNRYGLPDFYELHAWVWKGNPRGMFDDWNPKVSCRGTGDPA